MFPQKNVSLKNSAQEGNPGEPQVQFTDWDYSAQLTISSNMPTRLRTA